MKLKRLRRLSSHVLFCIFISAGDCCFGCENGDADKVALEVIPPWLFFLIVLGCPLAVLARLKWGRSPWDTQERKSKARNLGQYE